MATKRPRSDLDAEKAVLKHIRYLTQVDRTEEDAVYMRHITQGASDLLSGSALSVLQRS